MKLAALLLALFSFLCSAFAQPLPSVLPEVTYDDNYRLPGIELAEAISQITGTAISPLLGVTSVGAWKYYRTPASERHRLPWFCHPLVWSAGFGLLGLCFLKDVAGTAAPTVLKKPLDFAELFENKLSAIVAGSAFVPFIAAEVARFTQNPATGPSAALSPEIQLAAIPFLAGASSLVTTVLVVVLAVAAFLIVWLSCHAINVLIALSPFTLVDAALKLVKASLLSVVTASAFVNPWIGAAICFGILLVAGLVAPWAFRLTLFGTVFSTDLLRSRLFGRKSQSDLSKPRVFTARGINGVPARTFGRLTCDDTASPVFRYRPWMVLPEQEIVLPAGRLALSKGFLCPALVHYEEGETRTRNILLLLPRYCSQEAALADALGITDVRDGGILSGFKAIRAWLADTLGFGGRKLTAEAMAN